MCLKRTECSWPLRFGLTPTCAIAVCHVRAATAARHTERLSNQVWSWEQLGSESVSLVNRQRAPVAGYELGVATGRGRGHQRIVCGQEAKAAITRLVSAAFNAAHAPMCRGPARQ